MKPAFKDQNQIDGNWYGAPDGIPWAVGVQDAGRVLRYGYFRTKKAATRYLRGILAGDRRTWISVHMVSRRHPCGFSGSMVVFDRRGGRIGSAIVPGITMDCATYHERTTGPPRKGRGREVCWQGWAHGKIGNQRAVFFRRYLGRKHNVDPKIV